MADAIDVYELDFTKAKPNFGNSLCFPPNGDYEGVVKQYAVFPDEADPTKTAIYVYIDVPGHGQVRERFNPGNEAGIDRLMGHLISIGVNESQIAGKKLKFPFGKLVGRKAHFGYSLASRNEDGSAVKGTYPKFAWYTQAQWDKMQNTAKPVQTGAAPAQPAQTAPVKAADPAPVTESAPSTDDDMDWLK